MSVTREQKETQVRNLADALGSAENVILVDFTNLDVPKANELRRQVSTVNGHYRVIKNRLAQRAIEGTKFEVLSEHFRGATAIAYSSDDPVALAKALIGFSKTVPLLKVKAAVVQGQHIDAKAVNELAALPGKDELYAKLLMLLKENATQFVRVLSVVSRDLMNVLSQVEKKKASD